MAKRNTSMKLWRNEEKSLCGDFSKASVSSIWRSGVGESEEAMKSYNGEEGEVSVG